MIFSCEKPINYHTQILLFLLNFEYCPDQNLQISYITLDLKPAKFYIAKSTKKRYKVFLQRVQRCIKPHLLEKRGLPLQNEWFYLMSRLGGGPAVVPKG